jgi:3-deoxy-manno-octulosonate cytidylyltransferase (CMP-KDO synthetase)
MKNNVVVIIPARYGSTRLPGKPLITLAGRPLILHVLDRAKQIPIIDKVIVATDDSRILDVVSAEGETAIMTPKSLPTGTDRVGWVAKNLDYEIVVNLQGDEPLINTLSIQKAVEELKDNSSINIATLGYPLQKEKSWNDPNVVKMIADENNDAIYFSRNPIPYFCDNKFKTFKNLYQHLGVYIYRKNFLLDFVNWELSDLEKAENLEQLRILNKGFKIRIIRTDSPSFGVDTLEDVRKVEIMLR